VASHRDAGGLAIGHRLREAERIRIRAAGPAGNQPFDRPPASMN
jgi:hypothetical protein